MFPPFRQPPLPYRTLRFGVKRPPAPGSACSRMAPAGLALAARAPLRAPL